MIKHTCLAFVILITLLHQCSLTAPPNTSPTDWTEGSSTTACSTIGIPKIAQNPSTAVPLTSGYTALKTSYTYAQYTLMSGMYAFTQNIIKYYIRDVYTDQPQTSLQMSFFFGNNGVKVTQSHLIQSNYEFLGAEGPFCLLKQTDSGGNVQLTLYSFAETPGATDLTQLSAISFNSLNANEIFKTISYFLIDSANDNLYSDSNYANIKGIITTINTATSEAIVRPIITSGIQIAQLYKFTLNSVSSKVYTNLLFGLQINGNSFYTYVCPAYNSASPPYVYASDQTAIAVLADQSKLFSNHIVVPYLQTMMVATYDDNGENGNIFFILTDQTTYALSIVNMKTTQCAATGSLRYITDHSSFIIELNLDPTASTFYIVWSDDISMYNFTFLNSLGDNKNSQIIEDFSNQVKISSFVFAQIHEDDSYSSTLYLWIYNSTNIIKYVLVQTEDDSENILSITINKEFSVELAENILENSAGPNFQVTTQLKCECQVAQVTDMICFFGTEACTFTVQTSPTYCTPSLG